MNYWSVNRDSDEYRNCEVEETLKKKWKSEANKLTTVIDCVYILTIEEHNHACEDSSNVVGLFNTKDAAIAASTKVETAYGSFDSAIKDMFEDDFIDSRKNPPDNGVLLQIGSDETGEGDYSRLLISKFSVQGFKEEKKRSGTKEIKKTTSTRPQKKQKSK